MILTILSATGSDEVLQDGIFVFDPICPDLHAISPSTIRAIELPRLGCASSRLLRAASLANPHSGSDLTSAPDLML
jgi:hypothetical protein